ncbi:hypothetical protein [Azospirillum palustre]
MPQRRCRRNAVTGKVAPADSCSTHADRPPIPFVHSVPRHPPAHGTAGAKERRRHRPRRKAGFAVLPQPAIPPR